MNSLVTPRSLRDLAEPRQRDHRGSSETCTRSTGVRSPARSRCRCRRCRLRCGSELSISSWFTEAAGAALEFAVTFAREPRRRIRTRSATGQASNGFSTNFAPSPSDVRCIARHQGHVVGFRGGGEKPVDDGDRTQGAHSAPVSRRAVERRSAGCVRQTPVRPLAASTRAPCSSPQRSPLAGHEHAQYRSASSIPDSIPVRISPVTTRSDTAPAWPRFRRVPCPATRGITPGALAHLGDDVRIDEEHRIRLRELGNTTWTTVDRSISTPREERRRAMP